MIENGRLVHYLSRIVPFKTSHSAFYVRLFLHCVSSCVLQEVCVLQYSSDSVQKPMGPNNDVQKYDTIPVLKVLPGCVVFHCC